VGLAAIAVAARTFTDHEIFPGAIALVPVLGTAAVIWAGMPRAALSLAPVAGLRPVQWFGGISYSLYLWHWPIIMFTPYITGGPSQAPCHGAPARAVDRRRRRLEALDRGSRSAAAVHARPSADAAQPAHRGRSGCRRGRRVVLLTSGVAGYTVEKPGAQLCRQTDGGLTAETDGRSDGRAVDRRRQLDDLVDRAGHVHPRSMAFVMMTSSCARSAGSRRRQVEEELLLDARVAVGVVVGLAVRPHGEREVLAEAASRHAVGAERRAGDERELQQLAGREVLALDLGPPTRSVAPRSLRPSYMRGPRRTTETLPGPIRSLTRCACSVAAARCGLLGHAVSCRRHPRFHHVGRFGCDVACEPAGRDTPGLHGCRDCGKLDEFNISNACPAACRSNHCQAVHSHRKLLEPHGSG
jgi:hypothetical protein